jgi:hypothetical protein
MSPCLKIFILLIFILIFFRCNKEFGALSPELLKYETMHGWTGKISTITVFRDYSAVKHVNNTELFLEFSVDEKKDLADLLSHYSYFKRSYQPEQGFWSDISTHDLIYYQTNHADSVSIYEPLDSSDIPAELVELVDLLISKIYNTRE